jgi:hypothetical protein
MLRNPKVFPAAKNFFFASESKLDFRKLVIGATCILFEKGKVNFPYHFSTV